MPTIDDRTGARVRVGGIEYEDEVQADLVDRNWQLNEYEMSQEYGGPEEGDWWYMLYVPTGNTIKLHPGIEWEDAYEVRNQLDAFATIENRANNPYGVTSVLGGVDRVWRIENGPPRRDPEVTPHYE
jgi:hypothetical protein